LAARVVLAGSDITIERIFGPEAPGPYKHPAAITQLKSGDFYLVYYGGEGEYATDTAVYGSRQKKGEAAWAPPRIIADTPWRSEGNAVVWQAPDGLVWLFYVNRYGATWSTSRIHLKVSRDGAETWSDSYLLTTEEGTMVRSQPIVLKNGDYLLPIYHETGADTEFTAADTSSLFLRFEVKEKRWTESNRIRSRLGNLQPAAARITGDYLVCYCRRGGGYEGKEDGYIVRSESRDGGKTWSPGVDSRFPNPNAAVDFIRLQNGHLLLVYNDSKSERTPLTAAISTDDDRTYAHQRNLAAGPGDFAYPFAIQAEDGKIHVAFTSDERTVINRAVFEEKAILEAVKK
jgi:predicted neuraminidase